MKLTNILLTILICLIAFQKFPEKKVKTVSNKIPMIQINKRETKNVPVTSENKNNVKHSTTFRNYMDSDGRSAVGLSHNIRINKDYYISGGVTARESSYGQDVSGQVSITKYW